MFSLSFPLPLPPSLSPSLPPSLSSLAPPTLTLWVGTASGHTVTYGITVKDMTSGDDGGWSKGGSGGKVTKRKIQLMPTGTFIYKDLQNMYNVLNVLTTNLCPLF